MKRFLVVLLVTFVFLYSCIAYAIPVECVNCSDNIVQALNQITTLEELGQLISSYEEQVEQTLKQIQMVQNQIQQYENMVKNTIKLPAQLLNKVTGTFKQLASLTSGVQNQVGDIAALGDVFKQVYMNKDFLKGIASAGTVSGGGINAIRQQNAQYYQKWQAMNAEIERASQATFQMSGQQLQDLVQDADGFDAHISSLLNTPEGAVQALDSGNQLAALQIQEARQLRTLMLNSVQAVTQKDMSAQRREELRMEQQREMYNTDKLRGKVGVENAHKDPF